MTARRSFLLSSLILSALPALVHAAQSASRNVPLQGVAHVDVKAVVNLKIVQGQAESLVLTGDSDELAKITTEVVDGTLVIDHVRSNNGFIWSSNASTVDGVLTVKSLESLRIGGASDVAFSPFRAQRLALSVSGVGKVQFDTFTAEALDIQISGKGDVDGTGRVSSLALQISGLGHARLEALQVQRATVSISGKGDARLAVSDDLSASVSGMGEVAYKGNPRVTQAIAGMGHVSPLPA